MRIEPEPTPEEAAAIMAALETLREDEPDRETGARRDRWRLAGMLGRPVPPEMDPEGSLWSYPSWEGRP